MSNEFDATDASMKLIPTLGQAFQDVAFSQADEFINAGQSVREASSIVANLLIETAWVVAGCGVLADGKKPDPDKFRAAVEATLQRVTFKDPDTSEPKESPAEGGARGSGVSITRNQAVGSNTNSSELVKSGSGTKGGSDDA